MIQLQDMLTVATQGAHRHTKTLLCCLKEGHCLIIHRRSIFKEGGGKPGGISILVWDESKWPIIQTGKKNHLNHFKVHEKSHCALTQINEAVSGSAVSFKFVENRISCMFLMLIKYHYISLDYLIAPNVCHRSVSSFDQTLSSLFTWMTSEHNWPKLCSHFSYITITTLAWAYSVLKMHLCNSFTWALGGTEVSCECTWRLIKLLEHE